MGEVQSFPFREIIIMPVQGQRDLTLLSHSNPAFPALPKNIYLHCNILSLGQTDKKYQYIILVPKSSNLFIKEELIQKDILEAEPFSRL